MNTQKQWTMVNRKRWTVWLLGVVWLMLMAMVGCGTNTNTQSAQHTPAATDVITNTNTPAAQHTPAATDVITNINTQSAQHTPAAADVITNTNTQNLAAIEPIAAGQTLNVVATTNIVGDVVSNVGGDAIHLTVLMPLGTDPHTFEPTPQDIAAVADADVVFVNGVGLEQFLEPMLQSSGANENRVISVSQNIELLAFAAQPEQEQHHNDKTHADDTHHHHGEFDPHVWFSPISVQGWVDTIEETLRHADPTNAETYATNAASYRQTLHDLDVWMQEQVAQVPATNRKLVTDHIAFGYFAHRYGFEQIGAVVPGYSTMAEPSAQDTAALEDAIREYQVTALFVGKTVNATLAERIAQDTGTHLVRLYTGSLSAKGGEADTYVQLMRYDTQAIVSALK